MQWTHSEPATSPLALANMADRPEASWQVSAVWILSHPGATDGIEDFLLRAIA